MQLRTILLVIATVGVLGAGVFLLIEVEAQPEVHVPAEALAKARQQHRRAEPPPPPSLPSGGSSSRPPRGLRPATRPELRGGDPRRDMAAPPQTRNNRNEAKLEALAARHGVNVESVRRPEPGPSGGLRERMTQTNKLYDQADYEGALAQAQELLQEHPDNVRMLRVVVSSSCIMGQEDMAREYNARLPERDRKQMSRRCARYGVEL